MCYAWCMPSLRWKKGFQSWASPVGCLPPHVPSSQLWCRVHAGSQSPEWHPPLVHQVVHHHHLQIPKLKTTWYKHHGWHVHACMHACGSWDAKMSTKSNSVRAWHGQKTTQYLNCHRPPHSLLPYTHKRHIVNCMCSMVGHPRLAKISKTDGLGDSSQHHGRSFESQDLWAHEVALCMHGHACNQHVHM